MTADVASASLGIAKVTWCLLGTRIQGMNVIKNQLQITVVGYGSCNMCDHLQGLKFIVVVTATV